ncbi:MAG: recombinase family protein [Clostridiales bacterium]|nr:recombinase family protein [Clostridiales bacterium]
MNVVTYARYSSHNQTEQSIEGQIKVCEEYAKRNDLTIVGTYIDRALTGTNDKRPEFARMIKDSNKKFFEGILVYQLDRFARNRYDSAIYKAKLKKNGVRVLSAKENISDDASGILMESVLEGMAEYYSVELSQKVKRGMRINAEKCLYNGGKVPLGYKISETKHYEINEQEAEIVRLIYKMYANGSTIADIIRELNRRLIKTAEGKEFNKNSINVILKNEKYIGIYKYNDIRIENGVPQIIDNKTFEKVKAIMETNKKAPARAKAKTEYLLSTKLFCGTCNELMTGTCGTSRNGTIYYYYICNGIKKKKCNRKNIKKEYIEDIVIFNTRNMLTEKNITEIAKQVVKNIEKEKNNSDINRLENLLKSTEKQKRNMLINLRECEKDNIRKTIFEELDRIENELEAINEKIIVEKNKCINITEQEVKFFLNKLKNGNVNDIKYKKMLINVLVNKVYVYDDHIIILFNAQDKTKVEINIPSIEEISGSFLVGNGEPLE